MHNTIMNKASHGVRALILGFVFLAGNAHFNAMAAQNADPNAKSSSFADQIPPVAAMPTPGGFAPAPVPNLDLEAPTQAQYDGAHVDPKLFHKTPPGAAGNFVYETSRADRVDQDQMPAAGLNFSIPMHQ